MNTEDYKLAKKHKVLATYYANKSILIYNGWRTLNGYFLPPKNHEAFGFGTYWYPDDNGILIPEYILRYH